MDPLPAVEAGFNTIDADPALKAKAVENVRAWLTGAAYAAYKPQLEWLIAQQQWATLLDCFYQVMPFGTGGRRGAVGVGPNRMNLWTLGASVQGHCVYLREKFPGVSKLEVVVAYDVRKFMDQRKVYNPALPNPVLGLSSKDMAHHAARVYAANGITCHVLPADSPRYLATPELSYTIRHLHAHGGLNISASHNPPDDNGGKFYDERGGQPVPPDDQIMSDLVEQVEGIKELPWADAVRAGKVVFLTDEPHKAYVDLCRKQSLVPPPKFDEFQLVYTPLGGVGSFTAMEVLAAQGFRPIPVPGQMEPDGQFTNITKSPNPEVPESMDRGQKVAEERDADLVLATDPDADRLGGLARTKEGGYRLITGNEIAALLTYFKLTQLNAQGRLPASPVVAKSEVTTSLVSRIGHAFGAQVVDNLLVGFKYVAELLHQLEQTGRYEDVQATPADYIIGSEESHGVLCMDGIRDKDAAAGCLLLAELALDLKRQGKTVPEMLDTLATKFGYFRNENINIVLPGIEGKQTMARMLDRLRSSPPTEIGGLAVTRFDDHRREDSRFGPLKGATDAASRNVLVFTLGEHARVVLRPSGTEPKAKAYIEVASAPRGAGVSDADWQATCRDVDARVQVVADTFQVTVLGVVDMTPAEPVKLSR